MALFKKIIKSFSKLFRLKGPLKRKKKSKKIFSSKKKKSAPKKKRFSTKPFRKTKKTSVIKKHALGRPVLSKSKPASVAVKEELVGEITHYFSRISVVVIKLKAKIKVGDQIHIVGRKTDFTQRVNSLQIESVDVKEAKKGQLVGLKVMKEPSPGDRVFRKEN